MYPFGGGRGSVNRLIWAACFWPDLQAALNRFLGEHNGEAKPFKWTADPDKIIAAVRRGHQALDSIH
jgi:hypothetical protein